MFWQFLFFKFDLFLSFDLGGHVFNIWIRLTVGAVLHLLYMERELHFDFYFSFGLDTIWSSIKVEVVDIIIIFWNQTSQFGAVFSDTCV